MSVCLVLALRRELALTTKAGAYTNVQRASVAGSLRIACGLSMANSAIFGPDLSISGDTISNGSLSVAISGCLSGDLSDAILMLDLVSLLQED